jgi:uncharacterized membrane protein
MTKFQAYLLGYGLVVMGVGLALVGTIVVKNDTLLGFGIGIAGAGLTALKLPRPQDV